MKINEILTPRQINDIKKFESLSSNTDKLPKWKQSLIKRAGFYVFKIYAKCKLRKAEKEKNALDISFFNKFLEALEKKDEEVVETCLIQQGLIKKKI